MNLDSQNSSPTDSRGQSSGKADSNNNRQQILKSNSFSSYKSINIGRSNSPKSKEEEHEYILGECKKLIMRAKYTKAFINLRRYLMDQDLNKSLLPEFYQQVVHCCQKIIEKYFTKSISKVISKVPPLMSLCYQYLSQWESFLVNLQGDQECQNLIFGKSASISEQILIKKKSIAQKLQNQEDRSPKTPMTITNKLSRFMREDNERNQNNNQDKEDQIKEDNEIKIESFNENDLNELENEKFDALLLIKDKFHLYREQMLAYYLKTLFLSYRYHRMINQPMRSLKFLIKGSSIVRNFLQKLLFISSAELCRAASKIELALGNLYMELNQTDNAKKSYEYASIMGRNTIEIWFKIIGSYSKQDIPVKLEIRCEKSIIQFILILIVQSSCFELNNEYSRALETMSLADWFATKLLLYESSIHIKDTVALHYNYLKEKYSDLLQEESEIYKILRSFDNNQLSLQEIRQQEAINNKSKLQDNFNNYLYQKGECKELNQNMIIIQKKPTTFDTNNKSNPQILSSELIPAKLNSIGVKSHPLIDYLSPINSSQDIIPGYNQAQYQIYNEEYSNQQNIQQQQQGQENVKNNTFFGNGGGKNIHNRSMSDMTSFYNEQTTQITGLAGLNQTHTSKFHSFQGNQLQVQQGNKKSYNLGNTTNNANEQTPTGVNSLLNTNRQSFSTYGLDLQSIINNPSTQPKSYLPSTNNIQPFSQSQLKQQRSNSNSNLNNLNGSFQGQGLLGSPIVYSSLVYQQNSNHNNLNYLANKTNDNNNISNTIGANSNNSSFVGQQFAFNNNIGSQPLMSDCHFFSGNNNGIGPSLITPRNQDFSSLVSNQLNCSNQSNKINFGKSKGQDFLNRKGTLDSNTYQFIERPSSAETNKTNSKIFHANQLAKNKKQKKQQQQKTSITLNQNDLQSILSSGNTPSNNMNDHPSKFQHLKTNNQSYLQGSYNHENRKILPNDSYKQIESQNLLKPFGSSNNLHPKLNSMVKSSSHSRLGSFYNINQTVNPNVSKQHNHKPGELEHKDLKVITSELYVNKNPPQFSEEPEKIEQLKQKYRFMRDDENDLKEAELKKEVKYRFMKIPLDQRRDLIDLDICMKKIINEELVQEREHENYPQVHWKCEKTLQQVNMDKKEFAFANLMVQFKQKNGNGQSIPQLLNKKDSLFSSQKQLKSFNQQTALLQAKEAQILQQQQDQILENQAFQKIINSSQIQKPQKLDISPQPQLKDSIVRSSIGDSLKDRLIKAAQVQKQIDTGYDGYSAEGSRGGGGLSQFARAIENPEKNKKIISKSCHNSTPRSQQERSVDENSQILQQNQVEIADALLKQIVLFNEQEREQINKNIQEVQNKHTKIGIKDLILTLQQKEEEEEYIQLQQQKQQSMNEIKTSQSQINQSIALNNSSQRTSFNKKLNKSQQEINKQEQNEELSKSKKQIGIQNAKKSHSGRGTSEKPVQQNCNINPTYFNLKHLKQEFGNIEQREVSKSNVAFEVDKFLSLAQSTKNSYQMKLMKQNPFNITDVAVLNKLKNQEQNRGTSQKANTIKPGQKVASIMMPRRFTLLAQQKKID